MKKINWHEWCLAAQDACREDEAIIKKLKRYIQQEAK